MTVNSPETLDKMVDCPTADLQDSLILDEYAIAAMEDRCAPRLKLHMPAMLRPSGSSGFQVIIQDLSISGFSAEAFTGQPVGSRIWITIPGLAPIAASVVRNDGTTVGCAFSNLLNAAIFDNLLARYSFEE